MEVLKRKRFGPHGLIYHLAKLWQACLSWDTCFRNWFFPYSLFFLVSIAGARLLASGCIPTLGRIPWNPVILCCKWKIPNITTREKYHCYVPDQTSTLKYSYWFLFHVQYWNWNDPIPWDDEMARIFWGSMARSCADLNRKFWPDTSVDWGQAGSLRVAEILCFAWKEWEFL